MNSSTVTLVELKVVVVDADQVAVATLQMKMKTMIMNAAEVERLAINMAKMDAAALKAAGVPGGMVLADGVVHLITGL